MDIYKLKYGCNNYQDNSTIDLTNNKLFEILNGKPGYINILDAINSWYLVNEVKYSINKICCASFKHVSPAGVSIGDNALDVYKNARECDPKSSFGDFIAVNTLVTIELAEYIKTKVSDGIIALDYTEEALNILKNKKKGSFIVLKGNEIDFKNENMIEEKIYKNIKITQDNNNYVFYEKDLCNIVTDNKEINENIINDIILSNITLKYTQSNSVCISYNGNTIGIGAGQQSRIDCVKLAKRKGLIYLLRKNPELKLDFRDNMKYQEKVNATIQYLENDMSINEYNLWKELFNNIPKFLTENEKKSYISKINNIIIASDGFFPFRDNIDQSSLLNIKYISQPGGSIADKSVIEACNEYNMVMFFTSVRLFHHQLFLKFYEKYIILMVFNII